MDTKEDKTSSTVGIRLLTAWLVSWAVTTYLSALARTDLATAGDRLITEVFATADAVPPLAKLAFGFTLGALFLALRRVHASLAIRSLLLVLSSVSVFACATLLFPTHYYDNFSVGEFLPWHAAAAAIGGLVLLRGPTAQA